MRDITLGETFDVFFTTTAPDTGAPTTLSGTPAISAYVGNSTTQITAGITLDVDFDSVTGLNHVRVVATSGNGYTDNTDVALIITTGTVDGNSAVGYKVAEFTIGRSAAYTRLGAPAGASVSADIATVDTVVDAILVDTAEIGAAGAGLTEAGGTGDHLTAVPWNAAWDAEVQSEVTDALNAYDPPTNAELEARTLAAASYATAAALATVDGNVDAILVDTGTTLEGHLTDIKGATFSGATDSLEAIRNRGDAAWITATGFSTHSAADVWSVATRVLTAGTNLNDLSAAEVNAEVVDALNVDTYAEPTGVPGATVSLSTKLGYLYMALRNKITITSTKKTFYDDSDAAEWEKDLSDDGSTYTESEGNAI